MSKAYYTSAKGTKYFINDENSLFAIVGKGKLAAGAILTIPIIIGILIVALLAIFSHPAWLGMAVPLAFGIFFASLYSCGECPKIHWSWRHERNLGYPAIDIYEKHIDNPAYRDFCNDLADFVNKGDESNSGWWKATAKTLNDNMVELRKIEAAKEKELYFDSYNDRIKNEIKGLKGSYEELA